MEIERVNIGIDPRGYQFSCKHCGKVHSKGAAVIEIFVRNESDPYLLQDVANTTICCGGELKIPRTFKSAEDAVVFVNEEISAKHVLGDLRLPLVKYGTPIHISGQN